MITSWQVGLDDALAVLAGAAARAVGLGIPVAVAVVDAAGLLVAVHRGDGVQPAGPDVAIAKARAAALFRRPTAAFEEVAARLDKPSVLLLTSAVPAALPVAGGLPIPGPSGVAGAVGVSGGNGEQDVEVAAAGVAALARTPG